ncbi:MAG: aldehyde dehydrogenase (NADP(+)) [bacterium]
MRKSTTDTRTTSPAEIDRFGWAAKRAARVYGATTSAKRAAFLRDFASRLEQAGDDLIETTHNETSLPLARLRGERMRSVLQLRMFADMLDEGSWLDVRIEPGDPKRPGSPKPELRRTQVPLGPVAVFGASNFPYAFSIAGGDVASALAAGCPVIFKGHPAHPRTTEMVASIIREAVEAAGLPEAVFTVVWGGIDEGIALVKHPAVAAVGFTGSLSAGKAIAGICAARPRPIPVYAEMGSVNPVFLLPGALAERGAALAKEYAQSLTLGTGQFCTNPGIVVGLAGSDFDTFQRAVGDVLAETSVHGMLTESIEAAYIRGVHRHQTDSRLKAITLGNGPAPAFFSTSAVELVRDPSLGEELFGPCGIAVSCQSVAEMEEVCEALTGQLTTTIHFAPSDTAAVQSLLPALTDASGRVVANGFPTGVEVCPAMHHGGPYPATSDSRSTSVGTAAALRFIRPVVYQDFPVELLSEELQG